MTTARQLNEMLKEAYSDIIADTLLPPREYNEKMRARSDKRSMDEIHEDANVENIDRAHMDETYPERCPCCGSYT